MAVDGESGAAKLVLEGLGRSFGSAQAVADVNLVLRNGEPVTLLGPSGCGKTTTLRIIAGFIEPSAGRIVMNQRVLSQPGRMVPPEERGMSMIFQSYAIWPNMTVGENVVFGLQIRKLPTAELSGGEQQRVSLARTIVIEPEVLLLDEPFSNLDANLHEEMRFEIRRLYDEFCITTIRARRWSRRTGSW